MLGIEPVSQSPNVCAADEAARRNFSISDLNWLERRGRSSLPQVSQRGSRLLFMSMNCPHNPLAREMRNQNVKRHQ